MLFRGRPPVHGTVTPPLYMGTPCLCSGATTGATAAIFTSEFFFFPSQKPCFTLLQYPHRAPFFFFTFSSKRQPSVVPKSDLCVKNSLRGTVCRHTNPPSLPAPNYGFVFRVINMENNERGALFLLSFAYPFFVSLALVAGQRLMALFGSSIYPCTQRLLSYFTVFSENGGGAPCGKRRGCGSDANRLLLSGPYMPLFFVFFEGCMHCTTTAGCRSGSAATLMPYHVISSAFGWLTRR